MQYSAHYITAVHNSLALKSIGETFGVMGSLKIIIKPREWKAELEVSSKANEPRYIIFHLSATQAPLDERSTKELELCKLMSLRSRQYFLLAQQASARSYVTLAFYLSNTAHDGKVKLHRPRTHCCRGSRVYLSQEALCLPRECG